MKYISIFGKLKYLEQLINTSYIYPIFISIFLVLTILLFTKKIKRKNIVILMLITYLSLLTITISNNYQALSKIFDSISTNIFTNIYFPSTQIYLFTIIVIDTITIAGVINIKKELPYKIANGICFFSTKFLLILILDVISKNNIDIFSKKSLFSNINLVILLELSISIFILWLISLAIIYIANKITERIMMNQTAPNLIENTNILNTIATITEEEPKEYHEEQTINIQEQPAYSNAEDNFSLNDLTFTINESFNNNNQFIKATPTPIEEPQINSDILFEKLLNNGLPIITNNNNTQVKTETSNSKDNYTLNDYKIFNKMLKDVRATNKSNIININKELELKLISKYTEAEYKLFKGMLKSYSN